MKRNANKDQKKLLAWWNAIPRHTEAESEIYNIALYWMDKAKEAAKGQTP